MSLTAVICKVMETVIKEGIVEYLERRQAVSNCQHGFVKGRSCLTNLLEVLEDWTESLDAGYGIDVIYLGYRKAFDTVPHKRLLEKLARLGMGDRLLKWIQAFYRKGK